MMNSIVFFNISPCGGTIFSLKIRPALFDTMMPYDLWKLENFSNLDDIYFENSSVAVFDVLMQGCTSQSLSGKIPWNYLTFDVDGRYHLHYGEVPKSNYLLPVSQRKSLSSSNISKVSKSWDILPLFRLRAPVNDCSSVANIGIENVWCYSSSTQELLYRLWKSLCVLLECLNSAQWCLLFL